MRPAPEVTRIVLAVAVSVLFVVATACGGVDGAGSNPSSSTSPKSAPSAPDVDDLDDGTHQVRVDGVDLVGGRITIDGVQVMEGTEAVLAYLADTDGAQLEGPQVYVRNGTPAPRSFPVDAAGSFSMILAEGCCEPAEVGWSGLANAVSSDFEGVWGSNPPFEVTIAEGEVTGVEQIYIP